MPTDDKSDRRVLRLVRGGRDRRPSGILLAVAPADSPPFAVDAVAVEDDTYSVLSADPTLREPADHPIRIWNSLKDVTEAEPGSVAVKPGRPLRLLAIVHDLARDPTWTEDWIATALDGVLAECDERGLNSLGLPPLGAVHGRLDLERFVELLRFSIRGRRSRLPERIWIVAAHDQLDRLREGLKRESRTEGA